MRATHLGMGYNEFNCICRAQHLICIPIRDLYSKLLVYDDSMKYAWGRGGVNILKVKSKEHYISIIHLVLDSHYHLHSIK